MEFHEDLIFKDISYDTGQLMLKLLNLKGRIVRFHPTEYSVIDPKMYKPDLVIEVEDRIYIIEFQSTSVGVNVKKRFRFYSALIDYLRNRNNKKIEVHVLSTSEKEQTKFYSVCDEAVFPIYVHSLKEYDGDEFLNMMNDKIENNLKMSNEELVALSLVPFMKSDEDIEKVILQVAVSISNVKSLNDDLNRFIRGIELIIADKFIETKLLKKSIANLLGGNMQIIEDYAKDYAREHAKEYAKEYAEDYAKNHTKENNENIVIRMFKEGLCKDDIARYTGLDLSFIDEALSK